MVDSQGDEPDYVRSVILLYNDSDFDYPIPNISLEDSKEFPRILDGVSKFYPSKKNIIIDAFYGFFEEF